MEPKIYFIKQLKKIRSAEFYRNSIKLLLMLLFIVLTPVSLYEKILDREYFIAIILIVAEIVFAGLCFGFFNKAKAFFSIKTSRIFQCVEKPELVNEIIVSKYRVVFEIKGMEDEYICIKNSEYRNTIIDSIKSIFGNDKVIVEVEPQEK